MTAAETADHLIRRLSYYPGNATRLVVAADAVDEAGMCGDALRWAAEWQARPLKDGDWQWRYLETWPMTEDGRSCPPNSLPIIFFPYSKASFHDHQYLSWHWFIRRFAKLRAEGRI